VRVDSPRYLAYFSSKNALRVTAWSNSRWISVEL